MTLPKRKATGRLIAVCIDPYCRVCTFIATEPECPGCDKPGEMLNELAVRGVGQVPVGARS